MPGWPFPSHGKCSLSSMCEVPHLAEVRNAHSQLSSGLATGLAHTDIGSPIPVDPINTSPGVHKTSGDSGSPIGTSLVLHKEPCLAPTSISSPVQLSPGKAPGLVDGINSLATYPPPVTDVGDGMLIGIPQSYWDEVSQCQI